LLELFYEIMVTVPEDLSSPAAEGLLINSLCRVTTHVENLEKSGNS